MLRFHYKKGWFGQKYLHELKQMHVREIPMTRLLRHFDFSYFYGYRVYVSYIYENMKIKFTNNK